MANGPSPSCDKAGDSPGPFAHKCSPAPRVRAGYTLRHRCSLHSHERGRKRNTGSHGQGWQWPSTVTCPSLSRLRTNLPLCPTAPGREAGQRGDRKPGAHQLLLSSPCLGLSPHTPQMHISTMCLCSQYGPPSTGNEGSGREYGWWGSTELHPRPQLCHLLS